MVTEIFYGWKSFKNKNDVQNSKKEALLHSCAGFIDKTQYMLFTFTISAQIEEECGGDRVPLLFLHIFQRAIQICLCDLV